MIFRKPLKKWSRSNNLRLTISILKFVKFWRDLAIVTTFALISKEYSRFFSICSQTRLDLPNNEVKWILNANSSKKRAILNTRVTVGFYKMPSMEWSRSLFQTRESVSKTRKSTEYFSSLNLWTKLKGLIPKKALVSDSTSQRKLLKNLEETSTLPLFGVKELRLHLL